MRVAGRGRGRWGALWGPGLYLGAVLAIVAVCAGNSVSTLARTGAGSGSAASGSASARLPGPSSLTVATKGPTAARPSRTAPPGTFTGAGSTQVERLNAVLLGDGRVLMVGGRDNSNRAQASAELFDPGSDAYLPASSMTEPRIDPSVTVLQDGRVLVAGGANDSGPQSSAELFDPGSTAFQPTGSMSIARAGASSFLLPDGDVLILGGHDVNGDPVSTAELYHPKSGRFGRTGSLNQARLDFGATELADGRVLVVGGCCAPSGLAYSSAELYDPTTGAFDTAGSSQHGRVLPSVVLLFDGTVLIAGGAETGLAEKPLASSELFDPATLAFDTIGSMNSARDGAAAVLLPGGRVLMTGGGDRRAELFTPWSGQAWAYTGEMTANRTDTAIATVLADGRVFILGGGFGADLRSAEIYQP